MQDSFSETLAGLPRGYFTTVALILGLSIGSFLNVVVYRLPRDMRLSKPRSFCPHCRAMIVWYRNIPLFSYLLLRGRCGECGAPISARYPAVEFAAGAIFAASVWRWGISWSSGSSIVFACAMLVLAIIDVDFRILPNVVTLPGIAAGLAFSVVNPRVAFVDVLIGAALGGGLLYGVAWFYLQVRGQEGMGMGDVKMIAMIGAFLGWQGVLLTIFLGSLIGSIVGIAMMSLKGRDWSYALPFGTFLALAAVIVDWGGRELLDWYWSLLTL